MTPKVEVHPVTPDRWPDMVELFERRGPRGGHRNVPGYGYWCMFWRDRSLEHGTRKKRAMGRLVRSGREPGLLAYVDGSPVGWVAVAQRDEFAADPYARRASARSCAVPAASCSPDSLAP